MALILAGQEPDAPASNIALIRFATGCGRFAFFGSSPYSRQLVVRMLRRYSTSEAPSRTCVEGRL